MNWLKSSQSPGVGREGAVARQSPPAPGAHNANALFRCTKGPPCVFDSSTSKAVPPCSPDSLSPAPPRACEAFNWETGMPPEMGLCVCPPAHSYFIFKIINIYKYLYLYIKLLRRPLVFSMETVALYFSPNSKLCIVSNLVLFLNLMILQKNKYESCPTVPKQYCFAHL